MEGFLKKAGIFCLILTCSLCSHVQWALALPSYGSRLFLFWSRALETKALDRDGCGDNGTDHNYVV